MPSAKCHVRVTRRGGSVQVRQPAGLAAPHSPALMAEEELLKESCKMTRALLVPDH